MNTKSERNVLIFMGIAGFLAGLLFYACNHGGEWQLAFLYAILCTGIPYGWMLSGKLLGGLMVIGSVPIMLLVFAVRLALAALCGWITYPIALIRAMRAQS